ncbi:MAG: hypothetical protein R3211_10300 [Balneolaceae bacterium]|nr:hypothetical protein [Balneolaceae bacterium]
MRYEPDKIYHIYNRGNNKQLIFFSDENYRYFLRKMGKQLLPYCNILAYCLMPNHFHWLVYIKRNLNTRPKPLSGQTNDLYLDMDPINRAMAILLSSYTKAINNQEHRTGSLFQSKTKGKLINNLNYALSCMHYIHQNPVRAGLVDKMEDWDYSSFKEFIGVWRDPIVDRIKTLDLFDIDLKKFINDSYMSIPDYQFEKNR